ncbi:MAG: hypothetical protein FJ313_08305, partial [Gemmatimonadetes bacterium]|nr:hypothetical protein [Gemmatimonadota bacterium]
PPDHRIIALSGPGAATVEGSAVFHFNLIEDTRIAVGFERIPAGAGE